MLTKVETNGRTIVTEAKPDDAQKEAIREKLIAAGVDRSKIKFAHKKQ